MKAVVWSKDNCPFCVQAKQLLSIKGIEYEEKKIGESYTIEDLHEAVPGASSVPQIFLDEKYIGGFTKLRAHLVG